ncbi:uncharacterized protein LOC131593550 isoform X2 [Vicia villosa]|uniref:uncharacterized protein LOC131593550 isoform X2 n=1 Tax=Vicia villosa TaxID=3911 RepID=UPI00273A7E10|nr:uncharacterized protein LOC131593550 isoform X2 [Vicia villosa]XP_058722075.1 uncharacterized protein LOC131593550 isoform X2 [Vicia villosa]XP_058722076.1 uncharacterized protein LOC131593550 isoform X2 [Vicia villosa]XP_058722077.1 uncharacterized protein LOC131593550 isoform X2 [Vicia villosa]XP_058722079.1 uncharacterized protein LOC131593550 isoform X2 [Vicia villosa]
MASSSSSTPVSSSTEVPIEFLAPVEDAEERPFIGPLQIPVVNVEAAPGAQELPFIGPIQALVDVEAAGAQEQAPEALVNDEAAGAQEQAPAAPGEAAQELPFMGPFQGPVNNDDISKFNLKECKKRLSIDGFALRRLLVDESWCQVLDQEMEKPYFTTLCDSLQADNRVFCPPRIDIFRAFNYTPFQSVKVVLLGQKKPYAYKGWATGLGYSVPPKVKVRKFPPELQNIFSEVVDEFGGTFPTKGSLEKWALQGVLMLPLSSLTVIENRPTSHSDLGWEQFLNRVISFISDLKTNVVFMLWGKDAEEKIRLIDPAKHCILKAASPSNLSADRGFFGCRNFRLCNDYLQRNAC